MYATTILLLSLIFGCFQSPQVQSSSRTPEGETARSVLAKHIKAIGGQDKLKNAKPLRVFCDVFINEKKVGSSESCIFQGKYITVETMLDGTTRRSGTDGKNAWRIALDGTAELLTGQEAQAYVQTYASRITVEDWLRGSKLVEYVGDKTIDGRKLRHLVFVEKDNDTINRYFDAESNRLVREEQVLVEGDWVDVMVTEASDYQKCEDGLVRPRRHINRMLNHQYKVEFKTTRLKIFELGEENPFELPAKIKELILPTSGRIQPEGDTEQAALQR